MAYIILTPEDLHKCPKDTLTDVVTEVDNWAAEQDERALNASNPLRPPLYKISVEKGTYKGATFYEYNDTGKSYTTRFTRKQWAEGLENVGS